MRVIMTYFIEDFIENTNNASTKEEAFELYQKALNQFGLNSAVYTLVTDHPSINQQAGHGVKCNFPEHWMKHYIEKNYVDIDPVILNVLKTYFAFTWDELIYSGLLNKAQIKILNEAQESGLHHGVGIPIHGPCGEIAGVGLASTTRHNDLEIDKNTLCKLKFLTEQFHLVYSSLCNTEQNNQTKPISLSKREIETLKWWASDKSSEEIGVILNCSGSAVRFHVQNIYKKLNANSRILAVTKAIRLGLISADSLRTLKT